MRIGSVFAVTACTWLLSSGIPSPAAAQAEPPPIQTDKEPVAVLDLESSGARAVAGEATERLREEWSRTGTVAVVERDAMRERFKEHGFKQSGCVFIACTLQAGKILGARKLVTGRLTRIDQTHWELRASLFDVETGDIIRSAKIEHEGEKSSLLDQGIKDLVARLTEVAAVPEEVQAIPPPEQAVIGPQPQAPDTPEQRAWKSRWGWGLGASLLFAAGAIVEADQVQQSNIRQQNLIAQSQSASSYAQWLSNKNSYQKRISDQAKIGDQAATLGYECAALSIIAGTYAVYQYVYNKPLAAAASYELVPVPLRTGGYAVVFSASF